MKLFNFYKKKEIKVDPKWYDKDWLVILWCILFFPLGLYGLWKTKSISSINKKYILGVLAIILVLSIYYDKGRLKNAISSSLANQSEESNSVELSNIIEVLNLNQLQISSEIEPIYFAAPENDTIELNLKSNYPIELKITSYVENKEVLSIYNSKIIHEKLRILNTDIYILTIKSMPGNYADLNIKRLASKDSKQFDYLVISDTIVSEKELPNSIKSEKFKFTNIFSNPHKATVNSGGKKDYTGFGENRIIIPVDLPKDSKEWLYRLDLSYRDKTSETTLYNDMNNTWNKVNKTLAIATSFGSLNRGVIISRGATNIANTAFKSLLVGQIIDLGTLLYDQLNKVPQEEAYLNYYLITGEQNAKKFLDGQKFDYKLTSSQKNIQSIQELEKKVTTGQIYIGLENTNIKEQVYAKFEAVAISNQTVYVQIKHAIKREIRLKSEEKNEFDKKLKDSLQSLNSLNIKKECDALMAEYRIELAKLEDIESFQFGRTSAEKQTQIEEQNKVIKSLKERLRNCKVFEDPETGIISEVDDEYKIDEKAY